MYAWLDLSGPTSIGGARYIDDGGPSLMVPKPD
jgi:hypothetical protein